MFWHLNPKKLTPFFEAYKRQCKRRDEEAYMQGFYNLNAFQVALSHFGAGLTGKKSDAKYLEAPIMVKAIEEAGMTQDELDERELEKMLLAEEAWAINDRLRGLPETTIK